jgi:hypothetical protein
VPAIAGEDEARVPLEIGRALDLLERLVQIR